MMSPAWPETIVLDHEGTELEKGRKTALLKTKIVKVFGHLPGTAPQARSSGSLRSRLNT